MAIRMPEEQIVVIPYSTNTAGDAVVVLTLGAVT